MAEYSNHKIHPLFFGSVKEHFIQMLTIFGRTKKEINYNGVLLTAITFVCVYYSKLVNVK